MGASCYEAGTGYPLQVLVALCIATVGFPLLSFAQRTVGRLCYQIDKASPLFHQFSQVAPIQLKKEFVCVQTGASTRLRTTTHVKGYSNRIGKTSFVLTALPFV